VKKNGFKIDLKILRQGAMLHDIVKVCDFKELDLENFTEIYTAADVQFWTQLIKAAHKDGHVLAAYNILKGLGEDELAVIVKKHGYNSLIDEKKSERPQTWEEKIVYYADKRVMHDQVVSLAERLEDGRRRYFPAGDVPVNEHLVEKAIFKLEVEIMKAAGMKPEDISHDSV
jgi:hypothetical protein